MKKVVLLLLVLGIMASSCSVTNLRITDTRNQKFRDYKVKEVTFTPDSLIAVQILKNNPNRKFRPMRVPLDAFPYYAFEINAKNKGKD